MLRRSFPNQACPPRELNHAQFNLYMTEIPSLLWSCIPFLTIWYTKWRMAMDFTFDMDMAKLKILLFKDSVNRITQPLRHACKISPSWTKRHTKHTWFNTHEKLCGYIFSIFLLQQALFVVCYPLFFLAHVLCFVFSLAVIFCHKPFNFRVLLTLFMSTPIPI